MRYTCRRDSLSERPITRTELVLVSGALIAALSTFLYWYQNYSPGMQRRQQMRQNYEQKREAERNDPPKYLPDPKR